MASFFSKYFRSFGPIQFWVMAFVWGIIFALPVFVGQSTREIVWSHIFKVWIEYGFVFILFLLNHFFLFPLFLKGQKVLYFSSIVVLLGALFAGAMWFNIHLPELLDGFGASRGMPIPENFPQHGPLDDAFAGMPHHGRRPEDALPPSENLIIVTILLFGFDAGLTYAGKWMKAEQNRVSLEKENIKNQMAFLQNQVSPHFFMNTLNNIHALIDINAAEAKEAIIRLSDMMAYMLYESQAPKVTVQKELDFIRGYVDLMQLRFTDDVEIILEIPDSIPDVSVPPLLTISFIENAFKHGVSYRNPSYIYIRYVFKNDRMFFETRNRIQPKAVAEKNAGIGLVNAQKRLDLLFANRYRLEINSETPEDEFVVQLTIPL